MDMDPSQPCETLWASCSSAPQKGTTLSRDDGIWEAHRSEIHRVYMKCNKTLPETMRIVEETRGLKASTRKWKMKLKDWGYEKYLTDLDKRVIVAKAEKRRREGKETIFYHGKSEITTARIENFKRRKTMEDVEVTSPVAETPAYITYQTPRCDLEESTLNSPILEMTSQTQGLTIIQEEKSQDLSHSSATQSRLYDVRGDDSISIVHQDQNTLVNASHFIESGTNPSTVEDMAPTYPVGQDSKSITSNFQVALESWVQLDDESSVETRRVLSHLAQLHESRNLVGPPVSPYRIVVSGFRIAVGSTTLQHSPQETESLAKVLVKAEELEEAVLWYKAAIQGYQSIKLLHSTLECRYGLGLLLQRLDRSKEAIDCLNSAVVGHLRHEGELDGTSKVLKTLCELYTKINYSNLWDHVISSLTAIQTQLEKPHYKFDLTSEDEDTFNFFYLADAFSLMLKFNTAESILSCLVPRIPEVSYVKSVYEYYYARNRGRLGHYVESASRLLSSHSVLVKIKRQNGSLAERVKRRLSEVLVEIKELSKLALMQSGFEGVLLPGPNPAFQIVRTGYITGLSTSPRQNIFILLDLEQRIQDLCS